MNATAPSKDSSWRKSAVRVGASVRLVDAGVTVKDRILLHLLDYWGQIQRGEWPPELTQDGIAGVVGVSRSHVAVTLPDLINEGLIDTSVERVRGRPRRVKVYFLSYRGGQTAGPLARRVLACTVTAVDDTGEWELPVDGLIQVNRVHMLVALRIVDEDNHVDLRKASELTRPPAEAAKAAPAVAPVAALIDVEVVEEVTSDRPPREQVAAPVAVPPAQPTPPTAPPKRAPAGMAPAQEHHAHQEQTSQEAYPAHQQASQEYYGYQKYQYRPGWWSPLRFGSGRRPVPSMVATSLLFGFLCLMLTVTLFGTWPVTCGVVWIPLAIVGVMFAYNGFKTLWAVGPAREVWTATAYAVYMFIPITMICFALFGSEAVVDLGWVFLILGLPSPHPGLRSGPQRGASGLLRPVLRTGARNSGADAGRAPAG
jgi:hypothetical protein